MKKLTLSLTIIALIGLTSCGKKDADQIAPPYDLATLSAIPYQAENLLAGDIEPQNIKFMGETKTIKADSAHALLGASAEMYLVYQMVGITAAKYSVGDKSVYVEIAQVGDNSAAYGYYARIRADGVALEKIGAEAFVVGNSLYMTKGNFAATISADDESGLDAARAIATEIAGQIDADLMIPRFFILFPFSGKVNPSGQYHPYQFLGIPGVDQVYSVKYGFEGDTLTLFMSRDDTADRFEMFKKYAESVSESIEHPVNMAVAQDSVIAFHSTDHGLIVTGHVQEKLIGAVGYKPEKHERLVSGWFKGLKQ